MAEAGSATQPNAVSALRAIAQALSTAWGLDMTLDLIVRKTTEVMHVDSCTCYLLDPDGQTLRLRATTGLAYRALGRATLRVGEGMTGYAVQDNRPIFASNARHDPHFKLVDEAEETAFNSLLAVPLLVDSEPIGALNVQTLAVHDFSVAEVEVLSLIADLAGGALAKARLYDVQRRQIDEMQALAQVSEVVTSPQYLDDILDVVTDMAARSMSAALCSIFLIDESGDYLTLRSAKNATGLYRDRPPLRVGHGAIGLVTATGKSLYIRDVRSDSRYLGADLAYREGLVSLLSAPLSVRDRVIGVFNCYTATEHDFTDEQRALFQTLANQTALAIENARLVTNASVIREMNHRIKNNLQTVAMLMQLQTAGASVETRDVLEANIHRVQSIAVVHEVLSERGFSLVDVKDVLMRITSLGVQAMAAPERDITVVVEGQTLVLPTRTATNLALVVNELVQNAIEHAFVDRQQGQVRISLGRGPAEMIVLVRDDGCGLPADYQRGLGLEIVETLVYEELGGRLTFHTDKPGTEVSVRIPRTDKPGEEDGFVSENGHGAIW